MKSSVSRPMSDSVWCPCADSRRYSVRRSRSWQEGRVLPSGRIASPDLYSLPAQSAELFKCGKHMSTTLDLFASSKEPEGPSTDELITELCHPQMGLCLSLGAAASREVALGVDVCGVVLALPCKRHVCEVSSEPPPGLCPHDLPSSGPFPQPLHRSAASP